MGSPKKTVTADVKNSEPRLPRARVSVDAASGDSLHDSQLHFSYLAEATSAGIFILDGMIIRYANPAAALLTGYSLEELLNKPFWELADPTYGEVLKKQGLRQFDESIPTRFEIKMITKKGQERWIDLTAGITEANGRPSTVITAFDITERDLAEKAMQQAQETANAERQRLNDVLEALPAYLILLTPDYHVSFANRFFRERFGESNGRRCYEYLFNRGEPCENCETYKILSEGLSSYHWEWLGPDGHYYDIYDFPFVDVDGTKLIMEMGIDITERKQAEAELKRYQVHLEDRVSDRTEELQIANSQLESEIGERQHVEQALLESNRRLTLMAEVTSELLASDQPQQLVEDLCRKVLEYLDCQVFFNFLVDEEHHRLELNACAGVSEEEAERMHWLEFGDAVCGCVARDGKRIVAEDIPHKKDPRTDLVRSYGVKAYACHPLIANGQVIGTLSFGTRSRSHFSEDDLSLMKTVTDQVAIAMQRKRMEQTLRESEERFRIVLEHTPVVVGNLDRDLNYTWIYNPRVGLSAQDIVGKKVGLATDPETAERLQTELRKVVDQGVSVQVEVSSNLDAQVSHFEVHGEPLRDGDGTIIGVALVSIDVTRRKQTNEELRRLNRTLKALSSSNQAMLYAVSEMDFLNEVCRIIVEDCGHAMVWIGFAEDDAQKSVRPVASAGFEAGYLESLNISWADNEYGRGPTGTAIRTGKPNRCDDMLNDPRYAPWRELALKRGYASSIVLPLLKGKKAFGVLNIYSRQPYGFSDQEEKLLIELANDLAYGISSLRAEEQRARAEDALLRSEARYRGLFDHMSEGFALHEIICDEDNTPVDYRFIEINESFERLTGLKRELAHGKLVSDVIPNLEPYWIHVYGEVALTGKPTHIENYSDALGRYYDVYVYSPNPRQFATIFTDVTERKQNEARLAYLASFPEENPLPVVEVSLDWKVSYSNPTARRLLPDLSEQGIAHPWLADLESFTLPFRQGQTELLIRDITIGERVYQQSIFPLFKEGLIRIYGVDITERKKAEARLAYLASFPERNPHPIVEIDFDGYVRYANPATRRLIPDIEGLGSVSAWLTDWENIVRSFQRDQAEMILRDIVIGESIYQLFLEPLSSGDLIRIYGLDITLRKQAESEVLQERLKLQKIFDVVNVGLLLLAPDGTILQANEVAAQWATKQIPEMVGLQPGDALGCINALNNPQGCGRHANCQACRIRNSFEAVLQSGLPVHDIETENLLYLRGEERNIWLSVSADPIEIDGQQNVILAMNDITPLKQAESALRQAHDLLELRVQKRTEELAIANAQLRAEVEAREVAQERLEVNMQELEVAEEELRENNSALLIAHQQLEAEVMERRKTQEELQASLQELQVIEEELRNNNNALLEAQKGLVTERQRYQDLFEFAPDGYLATDKYGAILEANQVALEILGISRHHLLKKPLRVFIDTRDQHEYDKTLNELGKIRSVRKQELTLKNRSGLLIPTAVTVTSVEIQPGDISLRWMIRDISEIKRAEAQLHLQSTAMQAAANGITITDRDGVIQWCNQAFLEMTGYEESELIGNTLRNISSSQQAPEYYEEMWQAILSGQIWRGELVNRRKDGRLYTEEQTITPLINADGEITHFIAVKQDITERKQAESVIKENAARAAALSDISKSLAEASLDENAICDIVVKTTSRLIGDSCVVALASEDGQWLDPVAWDHHQPEALALMNVLYSSIRRPAAEGLAGQVLTTSQALLIKELGMPEEDVEILPAYRAYLEQVGISSLVITPLRIGNQTIGTFGLTRDRGGVAYTPEDLGLIEVLANRTAQAIHNARLYQDLQNALRQEQEVRAQLVQTEKFAVAGRMLASITHEINNPLQTIKNCLYLIRADTPEETPISDLLGMASSETNRMSDLVAQLRTIYHPATQEQSRPVYLPGLLNDVKALLAGHFQEKQVIWDMTFQNSEDLADYTVLGISDKLKQVFLNISLNAADAMQPDGGRLMVDLILPDDLDQVGVRFRDTGPGLSLEVQDKLFEPFVTTKENGLGLGLVICYNIVSQHNGHIDVHSQIGEGATFTIWLPVAKEINEPSGEQFAEQ